METVPFVLVLLLACCGRAATPAEIADRGWRAHEAVIAAGEAAKSCAEAAVAMRAAYEQHVAEFRAAFELDHDKERLQEATDFLEAHADRYGDLETRMEALADRCATDGNVQAVFHQMATP